MRITIPLPPAGFQRPRPGKHGGFYSPHHADLLDWRALVTNQMRVKGMEIIDGPASVSVHVGAKRTDIEIAPVVGSHPARPKGVRQDIDNILKFIMDALEGPAYFNDVQVVEAKARFVDK